MKTLIISIGVGLLLVALSFASEAQQPAKIPRLGTLLYSNPDSDPNFAAFRQSLRELGYVEGENLLIEHHFADGRPQRLPELAGRVRTLEA